MFDFIARFGKIKNENRSITLKADCECKSSERKREQSMNVIKKIGDFSTYFISCWAMFFIFFFAPPF